MEFDGGFPRAEAERQAGEAHRLQTAAAAKWRGSELADLRPCVWCRNFTRNGRCLAAARGELRAARDYEPVIPTLPRRCIAFLPPPDDPDQRPGTERYSWLAEAYASGRTRGDHSPPYSDQ